MKNNNDTEFQNLPIEQVFEILNQSAKPSLSDFLKGSGLEIKFESQPKYEFESEFLETARRNCHDVVIEQYRDMWRNLLK